ncbi:branched-chain amino acid ABC transporter permease [Oceanicola sp. 22II-s10i]|uniref:branched-chain amino acid ABC transporter permease n=1 Tax=Oceanicola sp. 22II-s10i TaxID=1317116 RepID=UPI000B5261B6|nr:branched-chain amino acid ABC transporter permease [Oceanicola sp. 22II-s10i]OWU83134.1 branched-chain amino acid ABC transporter permease [Oceanicola sp. 22II-s10i]
MFYRLSGVRHFSYTGDRSLYRIPFERNAALALLAAAILAPWIIGELTLTSLVQPWLIWTSAALGLNLVVGWAGQLHLGYAAVMGVGAYAGTHAARSGVPWEIAIVLAGFASMVIGSVFSIAALRVKGLYLALTTLAMQFVIDWSIVHLSVVSGGALASLRAPDMSLLGFEINGTAGLYYVALAWCVLVTIFMMNLRRSALGRALMAVREKDYAAEIIGVRSFVFKLVAFAASSFIAGVSGAVLIATYYHIVTPDQFSTQVSIQVLAMVIVGGLGSIIGTYLGTALILIMPGLVAALFHGATELFDLRIGVETLAHLPNAAYGALIMGCLLWEPLGLGRLYHNMRSYLIAWPFGYLKK